MSKNPKIIAENDDGDWIQVHFDDDGEPEWYDLFLICNTVCVSMPPSAFENLKQLFKKLEIDRNKRSYVS